MTTETLNTSEMNLTNKQVNLIAFEAENVDPYHPHFMSELSNRVQSLLLETSMTTKLNMSYIVRRCYFLVNGTKLV